MSLFTLLKIILGILPFVLFCWINSKINLSKANRSRQFLMPVISLIYCIVALFLMDLVGDLVVGFLEFVSDGIPIINKLNMRVLVIYLMNIFLVLGNMLLKAICLPILNRVWASNTIQDYTSAIAYEHDAEVDKWFVKKGYANFRGFGKGFYYALLVISALLFVLALTYPEWDAFEATMYPFFGVLIFSEIIAFLSGMTKSEFVEDILGEDEEAYKVANYGLLRKILRDLYGDRVLYENTLDTSSNLNDTFDALTEMTEKDESIDRIMGEYFLALRANGEEVDINYVKSSVNLLNGNSTLFNNPFYNDLTNYVVVPITKQLINYKKCLIVVGRDSSAADVEKWINDGIQAFTGTKSLWKSKILDEGFNDADIGIIKFSDIYNLKMHQANKEFLKDVGFFIIIEPSRILASGQIGLSLLVNECEAPDKKIVYCACDRNCDGLVDALSHTLKTSITEVTATLPGGLNSSQMFWDADGDYMHHKIFPNISRYLGMGTEINSVALKYQIKNTGWIGSEKFPVMDMKWIAGQYYNEICDYADLPKSQESFNRAFDVDCSLWSYKKRENAFLVVEDEFQNLFEAARVFSSRAQKQGFINVISENYFLRDYMLDNVNIFLADPKAIPTIVPDYARTERNTVLKLIMMMSHSPVSEDKVCKEFDLCGISYTDVYETMKKLITKHCDIEDPILGVTFKEEILEDLVSTKTVKHFEIGEKDDLYEYARNLRNAYYIAEDEENEKNYIGAKLYGHVFQALLPGQFMTYDGKYYEVRIITPASGVVTRRAADHISDRKYYRQMRNIKLENFVEGTEMASVKSVSGIEIINGFADLTVNTEGYLEMSSYGNFKDAGKVLINNIPERHYKNKGVLKIKLPGMTEKVRYTVCLLLNEIFRTTYPNAYHYVSAVAPVNGEIPEEMKYVAYGFECECEPDCFFIVEDSDVDLGLIVSVERNLKRYLEIISDVLMWHREKMGEVVTEPEVEEEYVPVFEGNDEPKEKKKGLGGKIKDFFKGLFGKKKKKDGEEENRPEQPEAEPAEVAPEGEIPDDAASATEAPDGQDAEGDVIAEGGDASALESPDQNELGEGEAEPEGDVPSETDDENSPFATPSADALVDDKESSDDGKAVLHNKATFFRNEEEGSDIQGEEEPSDAQSGEATADIQGEDEEIKKAARLSDYQKNCFLKFGYDTVSDMLDIDGTIEYLAGFGFDNNPLYQVRKGLGVASKEPYDPHKYGAHLCDFCGVELMGGEFEVLSDGRERCGKCSATAIKTADGFREVFKSVVRNMEIFYNIKINTAIKVRMTDAKKIAKHVGTTFEPTAGFDGRVLGFAKKDKNGYSIYVENGSPKLAAIATIAHELTHIWQYLNWNESDIDKTYGSANSLEIYEGMAKWAEIQYLILLDEKEYAERQEVTTRLRDDAYGKGFIKFCEKYPLDYGTTPGKTPFMFNPPL